MGTSGPPSTEKPHAIHKPVVLVVDDDPTHHKLFDLIADRLEITTYLAASCAEALEALGQRSFDLILMDCRMPDVDGYSCTRKIRTLKDFGRTIRVCPVSNVVASAMPR